MRWNATDSRCRRRLDPDGTVFLVMPYWPNWVRIAACNCVLRGWPGTTRFIVSTVRREIPLAFAYERLACFEKPIHRSLFVGLYDCTNPFGD